MKWFGPMSSDDERVIEVSPEWFSGLLKYLQADERFTEPEQIDTLILFTSESKRLVFKEAGK